MAFRDQTCNSDVGHNSSSPSNKHWQESVLDVVFMCYMLYKLLVLYKNYIFLMHCEFITAEVFLLLDAMNYSVFHI